MKKTENGANGIELNGNTKRSTPSKLWCFTLNNWTKEEYTAIIEVFGSNGNKWIIGKEIGEQGTPHLQGYINFEYKKRPLECKGLPKRIHWERCRGSEEDNIKYCSKDGEYESHGLHVPKPLKTLKESQLFEWQKHIINIIKQEPDDRTIYWFWETKGCAGKTTFAKYLTIKHGAVPIEGKKNDILFCAANFPSDIYIFDFERSMEEFISYGAMEKIKNGYYCCGKYESRPVTRNCPHVICFANFEPDMKTLSTDRWKITEL